MWIAMTCGGLAGLGVFTLLRLFIRPPANVRSTLARIDAGRGGLLGATSSAAGKGASRFDRARGTLGQRLEQEAVARGWKLGRLHSDLAVMNQPLAGILATKVLMALGGFLFLLLMFGAARTANLGLPPLPSLIAIVALTAVAFFLPDFALRQEADRRRRDFRHVVGSFLDLVAMNLAGGRGLPEALMTASTIGDHWAMARIRQALANARLIGITPWDAMAGLGTSLGVDELRDLASALALAGDEGAKIRSSLLARAATLRRRELAEVEGKAGERSQSMLVAQLLMVTAFMIFLAYPAAYSILQP